LSFPPQQAWLRSHARIDTTIHVKVKRPHVGGRADNYVKMLTDELEAPACRWRGLGWGGQKKNWSDRIRGLRRGLGWSEPKVPDEIMIRGFGSSIRHHGRLSPGSNITTGWGYSTSVSRNTHAAVTSSGASGLSTVAIALRYPQRTTPMRWCAPTETRT